MPYLVKVGSEKRRVYGLTSQAYFIKRSGKKVITRWGAINVEHGFYIKFRWKWAVLHEKTHFFKSEIQARKFKEDKINYFLNRSFNMLPSDAKIYNKLSYK